MEKSELKVLLENTINPDTGNAFLEDKIEVLIGGTDTLNIQINVPYPIKGKEEQFVQQVKMALAQTPYASAEITCNQKIIVHQVQQGVTPLKGVKNIIAVASGKGGVGKSTTSTNIAIALQQMGARVGVLDADLYGPSQPMMLGVDGQEPEQTENHFIPVTTAEGIQVMSIGFLVEADQAMIWRGPMVSQALQQLIFQSKWDDLDYLIVDLPPGTGDIQLTLSQKIPVTGVMVVTTPQDIALIDAKKAIDMFRKVNTSILGILENMSTHICSECGHVEPIFGADGGMHLAEVNHVPLLGKLPLSMPIRLAMDHGDATKLQKEHAAIQKVYHDAALQLALAIARKNKDYSSKIPKIVIE